MTLPLSAAELSGLPKAELHCHLDGSVRLATLLSLMADDPDLSPRRAEAAALFAPGQSRGSLQAYLAVFPHTLAVLQTEAALERVAFELGEDAAAENVRWLEVRHCPALNQEGGLTLDAVVAAIQAGLARAQQAHGIESGQLICALRDRPAAQSLSLAQLAVRHRQVTPAATGQGAGGVVGFDLAGPERGHPATLHRAAFDCARDGGLQLTCHAGEDAGPESIAQAVDGVGAQRVGHGVSLVRDGRLLRELAQKQIGVEACLSSNLQTGAVPSLAAHPLRQLLAAGVAVSLSTDNRLVSGTTVTRELGLAQEKLGCTRAEIGALLANGFAQAFLPAERRAAHLAELAAALR